MTRAKSILSLAIAGCLLAACGDKTGSTATAPAGPATTGAAAQDGPLTVVLKSVRQVEGVGRPYSIEEASEGGTLVVLDYSVTNSSATPVAAWRMPVIKLVDGSGTAHDTDLGRTMSYQQQDDVADRPSGDLSPGSTVEDAAVFNVPKAGFDPATWSARIGEQKVPLAGSIGKPVKAG